MNPNPGTTAGCDCSACGCQNCRCEGQVQAAPGSAAAPCCEPRTGRPAECRCC